MVKRNLRLLSYARVSDVRGREGPSFISEDEQFARVEDRGELAFGQELGRRTRDPRAFPNQAMLAEQTTQSPNPTTLQRIRPEIGGEMMRREPSFESLSRG
jgi:hypothetical protein